jgi:hypothetical protein
MPDKAIDGDDTGTPAVGQLTGGDLEILHLLINHAILDEGGHVCELLPGDAKVDGTGDRNAQIPHRY